MWTGAKYTTSELVSNITQLESQVRCQLTWQEFDRVLWLCTLSSPEEFEKEASVVSPQDFLPSASQTRCLSGQRLQDVRRFLLSMRP